MVGGECVSLPLCRATLSPQILTDLNLEQSTWQLLYVLYRDRVASEVEGGDDPMEESLVGGRGGRVWLRHLNVACFNAT